MSRPCAPPSRRLRRGTLSCRRCTRSTRKSPSTASLTSSPRMNSSRCASRSPDRCAESFRRAYCRAATAPAGGPAARAALQPAATGHSVTSTLHTIDAQASITRIIDFFPPHEQQQVRLSLAGSLRGIISQRLLPRSNGAGRVAASEIMLNNGRTAEAIVEPELTSTLHDMIADGGYYNMRTFDQHLLELVREGVVSFNDAFAVSSRPQDFTVALRAEGVIA